jgi:hypothetical protein
LGGRSGISRRCVERAAGHSAIPARWFYDRRGSELFDDITRLPSYYPTRTETALLEAEIGEIARLLPKDSAVVEFGSGSSTKTPILLRAARPKAYVPIDISALSPQRSSVTPNFRIPVHPVEGFTRTSSSHAIDGLPARLLPGLDNRQFRAAGAIDLLRHFRTYLSGCEAADRHGPGEADRPADCGI